MLVDPADPACRACAAPEGSEVTLEANSGPIVATPTETVLTPFYTELGPDNPRLCTEFPKSNYTPYDLFCLRTRLYPALASGVDIRFSNYLDGNVMRLGVDLTFGGKDIDLEKDSANLLRQLIGNILTNKPHHCLLLAENTPLQGIPAIWLSGVLPYVSLPQTLDPIFQAGHLLINLEEDLDFNNTWFELQKSLVAELRRLYEAGAVVCHPDIDEDFIEDWGLVPAFRVEDDSVSAVFLPGWTDTRLAPNPAAFMRARQDPYSSEQIEVVIGQDKLVRHAVARALRLEGGATYPAGTPRVIFGGDRVSFFCSDVGQARLLANVIDRARRQASGHIAALQYVHNRLEITSADSELECYEIEDGPQRFVVSLRKQGPDYSRDSPLRKNPNQGEYSRDSPILTGPNQGEYEDLVNVIAGELAKSLAGGGEVETEERLLDLAENNLLMNREANREEAREVARAAAREALVEANRNAQSEVPMSTTVSQEPAVWEGSRGTTPELGSQSVSPPAWNGPPESPLQEELDVLLEQPDDLPISWEKEDQPEEVEAKFSDVGGSEGAESGNESEAESVGPESGFMSEAEEEAETGSGNMSEAEEEAETGSGNMSEAEAEEEAVVGAEATGNGNLSEAEIEEEVEAEAEVGAEIGNESESGSGILEQGIDFEPGSEEFSQSDLLSGDEETESVNEEMESELEFGGAGDFNGDFNIEDLQLKQGLGP